jgi:hypothetical protein
MSSVALPHVCAKPRSTASARHCGRLRPTIVHGRVVVVVGAVTMLNGSAVPRVDPSDLHAASVAQRGTDPSPIVPLTTRR